MDWDRRRFDERRGGESYRPAERIGRSPSRGYDNRHRHPSPRTRSPPRQRADTWVPSSNRGYGRPRSRSPPPYRRRSRSPPVRNFAPPQYERRRSPPRRFSPRRDERIRSPPIQQTWRSKSPYGDVRSRDASRARNSPRRVRDTTPGSQTFRPARRDGPAVSTIDKPSREPPRTLSPGALPGTQTSRNPFHIPHRDHPRDGNKQDPSLASSRHVSPSHVQASEPVSISRNSSPALGKPAVTHKARSRSPVHPSVPVPRSSTLPGQSPHRDRVKDTEPSLPQKRLDHEDRVSISSHSSFSNPEKGYSEPQTSGNRIGAGIPTQPKNHVASKPPPSGPYQGSRLPPSHHQSSHHISLLSAPTHPRRGPGPRDSWMGTSARRGLATVSQAPPAGPRASFSSHTPGVGYRHPTSRQPSTPSVTQPVAQRAPNHLAGLCTIVQEGRIFPSLLDPSVEKRLAQLDVDKEKLLDHMTETQKSKRGELRNWDRLDRESSICALKVELAEGHLQRMADETIGCGTLF